MKKLRFYFDGCDAYLNGWEFLFAVIAGVSVVGFPLFIKSLLLFVGI